MISLAAYLDYAHIVFWIKLLCSFYICFTTESLYLFILFIYLFSLPDIRASAIIVVMSAWTQKIKSV